MRLHLSAAMGVVALLFDYAEVCRAQQGADDLFTGGEPVAQFLIDRVRPAGFLDEGRSVYCVNAHRLTVWDIATQQERWSVPVGEPNWLRFSRDGKWFAATYGDDRERLLRDHLPRRFDQPIEEREPPPKAPPGHVKIWNVATRRLHQTLTLDTARPGRIAFSPDGRMLAVASGNSQSGVLTYMVGGSRREPEVEQRTAADENSEISLWDVASGKKLARLPVGYEFFTHVEFSPSGKLLAFCGADGHLTLWKIDLNLPVWRRALNLAPYDLQFSPDGSLVAVCGSSQIEDGGRIHAFDVPSGDRLPWFDDNCDRTTSIAFAPKGDLFVGAYSTEKKDDRGFRFWSIPQLHEGRRVLSSVDYAWPSDGVVRFSPDGKRFVDSIFDRLRVWDVDLLADVRLQRDIKTMRDRKFEVSYHGDAVRFAFPYDKARDRDLNDLPIFTRPFEIEFNSSDDVTDASLAALANQPRLSGLDLSGCDKFTPAGLGRLRDLPLKFLAVDNASFRKADGLKACAQFPQLEELRLAVDYSDDPQILAPLAALTDLRRLRFTAQHSSGTSLEHLAGLTKLEALEFEVGNVTDDQLRHLTGLTKLRRLKVRSWEEEFTGAGLAQLEKSADLEVLDLGGSRNVSDAGLTRLPKFKKLRIVNLEDTAVTGPGLAAFAESKEIEQLELPDGLTDDGLKMLSPLVRLRALDLNRRPITDLGLPHLAPLEDLESINLEAVDGIDGSGLAALAGAANLTDLQLNHCPNITDDGLRGLAGLVQMRKLYLPPQSGDAALRHVGTLVALNYLSLKDCRITDAGLAHLAPLQDLDSLSLEGTAVTDAVVPHLIALKKLRSVNLRGTKMTAAGVEQLRTAIGDRAYVEFDSHSTR